MAYKKNDLVIFDNKLARIMKVNTKLSFYTIEVYPLPAKELDGVSDFEIKPFPPLPVPVKTEEYANCNVCYFVTEEQADLYSRYVKLMEFRYNGGWRNDTLCGRRSDYDDYRGATNLYAVTTI
jgi:hypothetical protein